MKKFFSLTILSLLIACSSDNADSNVFEGFYKTSALLDFRCVALPVDKMPTLDISRQSGDTYKIEFTSFFPDKTNFTLKNIYLHKETGKLTLDGKEIGSWTWSAVVEKKVVNIFYQSNNDFIYFTGEKK